jgi:hypothetical protein
MVGPPGNRHVLLVTGRKRPRWVRTMSPTLMSTIRFTPADVIIFVWGSWHAPYSILYVPEWTVALAWATDFSSMNRGGRASRGCG